MSKKISKLLGTSFNYRDKLFLLFAFVFSATLGFLFYKNLAETSAIHAAYNGFNAGNIINDTVMADYNSMSEADIQNFLKSKNPCNDTNLSKANGYWHLNYHIENGHFVCMADERFDGESAAHIIWQAAHDYRINPRVLIVLLQKEQGLVTDTWPNFNLQYRSATGYGCPDTAACDSQYYGFRNQVRNAAELFRYILNNGSAYYPVGNRSIKYNPSNSCGSSVVNIQNRATSALYQYTPYQPNNDVLNAGPGVVVNCGAYGNINFYYYYTQWFGDTHGKELSGITLADGIYQFKSTDGLALSFDGEGNGASAQLTGPNVSDSLQQFRISRSGKYYRFQNVRTGKYIDVNGAIPNNGAKINLWDGNDSCAQKWLVQDKGTGYRLISACASEASTKSLDVTGAATNTVGTKIELWESNDTNAQQWNFVNISSAPVNDGTYAFKSTSGKVLTPSNEYPGNGTGVIIWENTTSTVSRFRLNRRDDGYYRLQNVKTGHSLDVSGAETRNGSKVQLWAGNDSCAQKWIVEKEGNDYKLKNACSGKALDINGGYVNSNNTNVQIWDSNSSNAQKWVLDEPTSTQPINDGEYNIDSALDSNYRLDVSGASAPRNGTNVQLWFKNNTGSQKYTVKYDSTSGYYTIYNAYSGRYLDASNNGNDGGNAYVYSTTTSCPQRWILIPSSSNSYRIASACTRTVLDVAGGGFATNGKNVAVYNDHVGVNQRWTFRSPAQQDISDGDYYLESGVNSNYYLDVNGSSAPKNGTNVQLWVKNNTASQKFHISYDKSTGYYSFKNLYSGTYLDVTGAVTHSGVNIEVWSGNSSCAQKWGAISTGNGYYRFVSACDERYSLDVTGAIANNGTNVQLWDNNNSNAQKWKLIKN